MTELVTGVISYAAICVAILVIAGFYVSWRATRLDRLHTRVESARAALDAALVRRSAVALELAASGVLDPATSLVLADAAHHARSAGADERELAESNLTRALVAAFEQSDPDPSWAADAGELLAEIDAAVNGVRLARQFYNDAVQATLAARRRLLGRVLHLAGSAGLPAYFEIVDTPPALGPLRGEPS